MVTASWSHLWSSMGLLAESFKRSAADSKLTPPLRGHAAMPLAVAALLQDQLEADVLEMLMAALQQAALGVPIAPPDAAAAAPARKEKGIRVSVTAMLLPCIACAAAGACCCVAHKALSEPAPASVRA